MLFKKKKKEENILKNDGRFHGYLLVCVAGGFWNELGIDATEGSCPHNSSACVVMAKQGEAGLK